MALGQEEDKDLPIMQEISDLPADLGFQSSGGLTELLSIRGFPHG